MYMKGLLGCAVSWIEALRPSDILKERNWILVKKSESPRLVGSWKSDSTPDEYKWHLSFGTSLAVLHSMTTSAHAMVPGVDDDSLLFKYVVGQQKSNVLLIAIGNVLGSFLSSLVASPQNASASSLIGNIDSISRSLSSIITVCYLWKTKLGEEQLNSFVENICNSLATACACVASWHLGAKQRAEKRTNTLSTTTSDICARQQFPSLCGVIPFDSEGKSSAKTCLDLAQLYMNTVRLVLSSSITRGNPSALISISRQFNAILVVCHDVPCWLTWKLYRVLILSLCTVGHELREVYRCAESEITHIMTTIIPSTFMPIFLSYSQGAHGSLNPLIQHAMVVLNDFKDTDYDIIMNDCKKVRRE